MTFNGRSYANDNNGGNDVPRGQAEPEQEQRGFGGSPAPASEHTRPPQEPYPGPSRPTYDNRGGGNGQGQGRGGYGGGNQGGGGGDYNRDPNYAFISYLYRTGKNGGFSVFLKRDMLEILKSLDEDDVVGMSPSGRDGWMMYARRVDPAQKEEFRRNGGRGGNRGGGRGGGGYQR